MRAILCTHLAAVAHSRYWHDSECLGGAAIPSAVRGYRCYPALFTGQKPKVATRHFAKHALPELNLIGSEEAEDRHLDHTVNSRIPGRTVEIKQHGLVRQGQTRLDELGRGDFAIVRFERTRSDLIF